MFPKPLGFRTIRDKVSRGAAFGDYDNDGDIDILNINKNDTPYLLRNEGGNLQRWINIRTEGVKSNRAGLGAKVKVSGGGITRHFEVRGSDSYLSSNDLRVHAGMGDLEEGDVEIRWPSGQVDKQSHVKVNQYYLAREGEPLTPDPRISKIKNVAEVSSILFTTLFLFCLYREEMYSCLTMVFARESVSKFPNWL